MDKYLNAHPEARTPAMPAALENLRMVQGMSKDQLNRCQMLTSRLVSIMSLEESRRSIEQSVGEPLWVACTQNLDGQQDLDSIQSGVASWNRNFLYPVQTLTNPKHVKGKLLENTFVSEHTASQKVQLIYSPATNQYTDDKLSSLPRLFLDLLLGSRSAFTWALDSSMPT
ncbi:MAG: hypothetical protein Q9203_003756 [Teloschistes exilis]